MKIDDILKPVRPLILQMEQKLCDILENNSNELKDDVIDFLFSPSKRIRPAFVFLCTMALSEDVDDDIIHIALALELLHSATLVHDDIIDESKKRRGKDSFYKTFGAKRAVILGDYLLSLCLCALSRVKSQQIFEIFSKNIIKTINGEINQFNSLYEYTSVDEYLNKTGAKTASLFVCAAQSVCAHFNGGSKICTSLEKFAYQFGTLFQLKNDIDNFKNSKDDIKNGIFTLCSIYFKQENPTCDIMLIKECEIEKYLEKSHLLINEIAQAAIDSLDENINSNAREIFIKLVQSYLVRAQQ